MTSLEFVFPFNFFIGWTVGDPHFVTLDGKNYTFNGLGEYIMVDARNGFFKLQARTKLAKGDGTATVFSAAVAKENNTSVVQVDIEDGGQLFFMFFEIVSKEQFIVVRP